MYLAWFSSGPKGQESLAQGKPWYLLSAHPSPRRACPEGATGLSPGFQPWESNPLERRALKGRQISAER
jgi:hypothetical protein